VAGLVPAGNAAFARRFAFRLAQQPVVALAALGLQAVWLPPQTLTLPLGLPDLPFHIRIDPLAGFFLMLLGSVSPVFPCTPPAYFREEPSGRLTLICLQYHVFLASMASCCSPTTRISSWSPGKRWRCPRIFWSSPTTSCRRSRRAGFLYLLIAHLGAIAILLASASCTEAAATTRSTRCARPACSPRGRARPSCSLFFGFGAKAGMIPLHAWLPEAHPAAPSPVSALMSGIMIKTAIYGMVRVIFEPDRGTSGNLRWEWGMVVLVVGAGTTLFGVLYALVQHDLKRLLAYHSVENIGIILLGLGMAMVFIGFGHPAAGALGLIAALYHTLTTRCSRPSVPRRGSILHSTGMRNLNDMGGLIRGMPRTAFYFLIGALAISALPPLNGFVSEWLTFQAALQATVLQHGVVRSLLPLFAATLALAGALTAMCFVKVYGIAFLGRPREPAHRSPLPHAGDAGRWNATAWPGLPPAASCSGSSRTSFLLMLNRVGVSLTGHGLSDDALLGSGWLWLVPTTVGQASYSPVIFFVVILAVTLLTFLLVRRFYHGRLRFSDPWDCGYPEQTSRMQDTADAFGQPIRHVFGPIYRTDRRLPGPRTPRPDIRSRSRTGTGTGSTCRLRAQPNSSPRRSRCCSRAGSASTCSTASSP